MISDQGSGIRGQGAARRDTELATLNFAFNNRFACGVMAACLGVTCVAFGQGATRGEAEKDPLLKAMLAEMDRSMTQLQLPVERHWSWLILTELVEKQLPNNDAPESNKQMTN